MMAEPYEGWGQGRAWPLLTGERAHYELAAGRDVRSLVGAIERSVAGGRYAAGADWDAPDLPERGMFPGPPVRFCHAAGVGPMRSCIIKLLRSREDGQVFDHMGPVWSRYGGARRSLPMGIFKRSHLLTQIGAGKTMRIVGAVAFCTPGGGKTQDDWKTQHITSRKPSGGMRLLCGYSDWASGGGGPGVYAVLAGRRPLGGQRL